MQRRLSERRRTTASALVAVCTTAALLVLDARTASVSAARTCGPVVRRGAGFARRVVPTVSSCVPARSVT
ncbi:hypothetical protein ACF07Y_01700 [Streptomyces sp. NPDC016566]|uniref:hypothetical protein n=1 Tax=unclassified Streptomyces TaxID=2593676 RepID=UPI0036E110EE